MRSLYSTCMLFLFCLNLYLSPSSCLSIAVCYKIQKYFWDFDNVQLFFSLVSIEGWWVWADMQYSHKISFHKTPLWDTWLFWTFWGLQNTVEYHFHFQFIFTFLSRQKRNQSLQKVLTTIVESWVRLALFLCFPQYLKRITSSYDFHTKNRQCPPLPNEPLCDNLIAESCYIPSDIVSIPASQARYSVWQRWHIIIPSTMRFLLVIQLFLNEQHDGSCNYTHHAKEQWGAFPWFPSTGTSYCLSTKFTKMHCSGHVARLQ